MSGHSKWANIKNRKGAADQKRSEVFTKLARNIVAAIRLGGGVANIESNSYLKVAVDKAKTANMPKENIERLIGKYASRSASLVELMIEGFGPGGQPILIEAETDNKNRTMSEIRLIFKNCGGNVGDEGSVRFLFKELGEIKYEGELTDDQKFALIDLDVTEIGEGWVEYEKREKGEAIKKWFEAEGIVVISMGKKYKYIGAPIPSSGEQKENWEELLIELEEQEDVTAIARQDADYE